MQSAGHEVSTHAMRRGFTLVEVLIVISIVTILAGMLFPVVAAARERARQAVCLSSERQLGLAAGLYVQDFDESLPSGTIGTAGQGWAGQVYPFTKERRIYRCPDDDDKAQNARAGLWTMSYAMDCNVAGLPQAALAAPSLTVLLFEVNDAAADVTTPETRSPTGRGVPTDNCPECGKPFGADYYATGNLGGVTPRLSTTIRPYHDPTSDYVAADGHARSLRGEQVSPGYDAPWPGAPQSTAGHTAAGTASMSICSTMGAVLTFSAR